MSSDGAEVKVPARVRALLRKASADEGEEPGAMLEALMRHGLTYRTAVRGGGRIVNREGRRR